MRSIHAYSLRGVGHVCPEGHYSVYHELLMPTEQQQGDASSNWLDEPMNTVACLLRVRLTTIQKTCSIEMETMY